MNVLVTGAAGHIGAHVCRELLLRGHRVTALVHNDARAIEGLAVTRFHGDLADQSTLIPAAQQCEAIIHAAGIIRLSYREDDEVYEVNVSGTRNVLDVAKSLRITKVVHVSSVHVFNQLPLETAIDETRGFVSGKTIFYDRTKRDAHLLAKQAADNGLNVSIVCPTAVLGPFDYKPSQLGKAIKDIYLGSVPAVVKGGFDFVDVRDVAKGTVAALEKGKTGETYLLGGRYYSVKQFADMVLEIKGTNKKLTELPLFFAYLGLPFVKSYALLTGRQPLYDKAYLDILRYGNKKIMSEKARIELDYEPRDLYMTITDTLKWFKDTQKI